MERLISLFGPLVMSVLVFTSVCQLLRKSLVRMSVMFHGYQHNRVRLRLPEPRRASTTNPFYVSIPVARGSGYSPPKVAYSE